MGTTGARDEGTLSPGSSSMESIIVGALLILLEEALEVEGPAPVEEAISCEYKGGEWSQKLCVSEKNFGMNRFEDWCWERGEVDA